MCRWRPSARSSITFGWHPQHKATLTVRRNTRNGNSAAEHLITALRCLYRHTVDDELIDERSSPTARVPKLRPQPGNRRPLAHPACLNISVVNAARNV